MTNNIHVPEGYDEVFTYGGNYTRQWAIILNESQTVIYQDPNLMESINGCPLLKPQQYVDNYHPEYSDELRQLRAANNRRMDIWSVPTDQANNYGAWSYAS